MEPLNSEKVGTKRQRMISNHEQNKQQTNDNGSSDSIWPRFLVLEPSECGSNFSNISPFAIAKAIQGLIGEAKNVNKQRNGNILIEVTSHRQSDTLLKCTMLLEVPIKVSSHRTLNTKKAIIRSRDLRECSEDEILTELTSQGVVEVKRMKSRREGILSDTNTLVLVFATQTLPPSIKAGYLKIPVEAFIPNPLRCYKCQQFGHHKDQCKRQPICASCGETEHENKTEPCPNPLLCINCKGPHQAYSKDCTRWKQEKEIQKLKITNNVSFPEARRMLQSANTPANQSYAGIASRNRIPTTGPPQPTHTAPTTMRSMSTQTCLTWPDSLKSPKMINDESVESTSTQTEEIDKLSRTPKDNTNNTQQKTRPSTKSLERQPHTQVIPGKPTTMIKLSNRQTDLPMDTDHHTESPSESGPSGPGTKENKKGNAQKKIPPDPPWPAKK